MAQERLTRHLQGMVDSADRELAKFAANVAGDPAHAFRWGDDAMKAAATRKIALEVIAAMAHPHSDLHTLEQGLVETLTNRAKYPERSTSPCSNLMHQNETSAIAQVIEAINHYQD